MKNLSLVIMIAVMLFGSLLADVVTIGAGDQISSIPMDFHWQSSLYECLFYPQELGFASASIDSLSFYNQFYSHPSNGATKIWMGSTDRPNLVDGWIPSSALTMVFDGEVDYPEGANTITIPLQTPFIYNPGNLVMMVQRPMDTHSYPGIVAFYCQHGAQPRARKYGIDGYIDPLEPPDGTLTTMFPRTTIYFRNSPVDNDLACNGLRGPDLPPAGIAANYQTCVINNGLLPQNGYLVKLFDSEDTELASLTGGTIQPLQAVYHTFSWVPAAPGTDSLYARVFRPDDEISENNQSTKLGVTILPEGTEAVTIGNGDMNNRNPIDFSFYTSLFECLYYPAELGFDSGTITALAFYNRFVGSFTNEPITIWMGSTNQAEMSPDWIPSTQLSLVFDGTISFPSGQNRITIPLQTPYNHSYGNLVVMIYRPLDTQYYDQQDNFRCQRGTLNRLQMLSSSYAIDPADPPFSGLLTIFPKTTFFYSELNILHDLTAVSVSGNPMPSAGVSSDYRITICNQGTSVEENFMVKLINESGTVLGSITVTALNPAHTMELSIPWTPDNTGYTNLYGQVLLPDDEVTQNNTTPAFRINVQPVGIVAITVGNGGSTGNIPLNMRYRASLFETVYPASEINYTGEITSLQFYNDFANDLPAQPTIIWLGETTLADLFTAWIPASQLTLVFEGNVHYPAGANDILIPLQPHYNYNGANLVLMAQRPLETNDYISNEFVTQNGPNMFRSREVYSDTENYNPNSPPAMYTTAMYPQTTFLFETGSDNVDEEMPLPAISSLGKAYPNPFPEASGTRISVSLKAGEAGTLCIYNVAGRLVKEYSLPPGFHDVAWDGTDFREQRCASGIYLYRLNSPSYKKTGKMVLLK